MNEIIPLLHTYRHQKDILKLFYFGFYDIIMAILHFFQKYHTLLI